MKIYLYFGGCLIFRLPYTLYTEIYGIFSGVGVDSHVRDMPFLLSGGPG